MEEEFVEALRPRLDKCHVDLVALAIHGQAHVVDLTLQLPSWADRDLRHEVLRHISELERQWDHAVTTNPTFVWGEPDTLD